MKIASFTKTGKPRSVSTTSDNLLAIVVLSTPILGTSGSILARLLIGTFILIFGGAFVVLVSAAIQKWRFKGFCARPLHKEEHPHIFATLDLLRQNYGLRDVPVFWAPTKYSVGAAVHGVFRRKLIVSGGFCVFNKRHADQGQCLLAHELAHIRNGDTVLFLVIALLCATTTWNLLTGAFIKQPNALLGALAFTPAIAYLLRRREFTADALAMNNSPSRSAYLRTLLSHRVMHGARFLHPSEMARIKALAYSSPILKTSPWVVLGFLVAMGVSVVTAILCLVGLTLEFGKGFGAKRPAALNEVSVERRASKWQDECREILNQQSNEFSTAEVVQDAECADSALRRLHPNTGYLLANWQLVCKTVLMIIGFATIIRLAFLCSQGPQPFKISSYAPLWFVITNDAEVEPRQELTPSTRTLSPSGNYYASLLNPLQVGVFGSSTQTKLFSRTFPKPISVLAFSGDGRYLAVASEEVISFLSIDGAIERPTLRVYERPVQLSLDDHAMLIVVYRNSLVSVGDVWRLSSDGKSWLDDPAEHYVALSSNGRIRIAHEDHSDTLTISHAESSKTDRIGLKGFFPYTSKISPDNRYLATIVSDNSDDEIVPRHALQLWTTGGKFLACMSIDDPLGIEFSPDARFVGIRSHYRLPLDDRVTDDTDGLAGAYNSLRRLKAEGDTIRIYRIEVLLKWRPWTRSACSWPWNRVGRFWDNLKAQDTVDPDAIWAVMQDGFHELRTTFSPK